jgi:hypothetical protein
LEAVDGQTGTIKWKTIVIDPYNGSSLPAPVIGPDVAVHVYVVDAMYRSKIVKLNPNTGEVISSVGIVPAEGITVGPDGTDYYTRSGNTVVAVGKWTYNAGESLGSPGVATGHWFRQHGVHLRLDKCARY